MTNEQLIALYNPDNARNLTQEEVSAMMTLTDDEIKVLADAYPKGPTRQSYLVLYDKNVDTKKQLYNLSSWPKLYNLRKMNNLKNWVPFSFKDIFHISRVKSTNKLTSVPGKMTTKRVVDLSAKEAADQLKAALEKKTDGKGEAKKQTATKPPKNNTAKGEMQASKPKTEAGKTNKKTVDLAATTIPDEELHNFDESPEV